MLKAVVRLAFPYKSVAHNFTYKSTHFIPTRQTAYINFCYAVKAEKNILGIVLEVRVPDRERHIHL